MQYVVKLLNKIAFAASTERFSYKIILIHWEKFLRGECFPDFMNSSPIRGIRFHEKLFKAATAKTSPSNLFYYLP